MTSEYTFKVLNEGKFNQSCSNNFMVEGERQVSSWLSWIKAEDSYIDSFKHSPPQIQHSISCHQPPASEASLGGCQSSTAVDQNGFQFDKVKLIFPNLGAEYVPRFSVQKLWKVGVQSKGAKKYSLLAPS